MLQFQRTERGYGTSKWETAIGDLRETIEDSTLWALLGIVNDALVAIQLCYQAQLDLDLICAEGGRRGDWLLGFR